GSARLCRILALIAVNPVHALHLGIVVFEIVVTDGPGRREPIGMLDRVEVVFSKPRQSRTVELRAAADVMIIAWDEPVSCSVVPGGRVLVSSLEMDGLARPVLEFSRQEVALLHDQDASTGVPQGICERATPHPRTDDHDVGFYDIGTVGDDGRPARTE